MGENHPEITEKISFIEFFLFAGLAAICLAFVSVNIYQNLMETPVNPEGAEISINR